MTRHPMDFLREDFLDPMGVTQEIVCRHLDLDNEHYFSDPRDYEQYLFYRVAFLRKKHELLKFINDPMQSKEV